MHCHQEMWDPLKIFIIWNSFLLHRPNKKIPVFKVTWSYLNLLVKPRINFRFSGEKKIQFYAFWKAKCLSKCIKLYFFQKKNVCLPYLKFSDPLPETHLFFYLALLLSCSSLDLAIISLSSKPWACQPSIFLWRSFRSLALFCINSTVAIKDLKGTIWAATHDSRQCGILKE